MKQFFTLIVVLGIMCGMISTQVQAQCNSSAPSVLAKWDFNSGTAQCNGAVPSTKGWLYKQTVPILAQNKNTFCPNSNSGCGQALLGSKGFSNTNDFANALCLSGYWRPGTNQYAVSEGWKPKDTVFKPEIGGNIYVEYKLPAGKSGTLTSFSVKLIQKQYNGTSIPYEKQGVGVYRNGVLVYNQTQNVAASNVNGTPFTFSFPNTADFISDGSAEVTWTVVFGLVNRLIENGSWGSVKVGPVIGYDDICLNGTCGGGGPVPVAAITPATCGATSPNNDGKITLSNFGATDKYDYVIGTTYTGSQTYATATAIPAGGVIASALPNPASATTYTVRVFNSGGCTTDLQVVLNPTSCPSGVCTKPTATLTPTPATCTGTSSNSNANIAITSVTNGDKVGISLGGTYSGTAYAAAQTLTGGAFTFSSLPNPNGNQLYTVRVFNASNDCYQDFPVTLAETDCGCKKMVVQVLSSDQADPNSTPNNNNTSEDDLATYEVCKSPTFIDLKLTKTVNPTNGVTCPVSSDFVWTLTLTNEGTMTATNIQVVDNMPLELLVLGSNPASGTTYNPIGGWIVPSLAANASVTLTITTKATKAGSFTNCAWVNTAFPLNDPDSTPGNAPALNEDDDDCATITVTGPNVPTITKEFSPSSAKPGTPVRLTLKINNNETTPITLTSTFVDNLPSSPAQMTVASNPNVSVNNATPVIAAAGSNVIFIPNGTSLPPGLTQIQVDVIVPAEGIYCNKLVPGALQTSSCSTIDTTEACIEFKNSYIAAPLLKKAFAPAMVQTNQNSTLTITIENRNSTPITLGQDFKDELPAGVVLAGVATGTCATISTFSSTNEVGLTSGSTIAPGTCTITVPVTSATAGDYCNTIPMNAMIGEVSNGTIMVMTGNEDIAEACLKVVASPIFDLALRKTLAAGQDSVVTLGATVNYNIRVFNQGTVDATNIQITDYIPTGMSLPTSTQWTATAGKATLVTPLPLLKAGRDTTLSISLTVENTATGDLINRSEISAATGGTDIDSTPDDNPANDAGGKERSPSDDSIYGNGTGNPSEVSALSDEDDADPAVVKAGNLCATAKMAVGIILAPQSIRTQNDIVSVTFGVVNNGSTPLSNVTFEGTYKLFKGSVGAPNVLTVTKSGDVNNDGIMQPLESWLFTATMTNTPYNPGDVFLICGFAKALCGTDTVKAGNADLLFTAGVNMDVEITNDCVKPGEFVEADLIARLLIDEDAAQNPGTANVGGITITLPKRRFEARNMRITSPLLNGGTAFDPFNPPVGLTIQTVTDQGGADGGRNTSNILDEGDAVNTARKPCSALGQNDVNCDFPDWVFKVKIQVPANYTGDKFIVEAQDQFDLYEAKEDPAGSGTFTAFSSLGAATESDKDTINIKPNAGPDQTLACSNGSLPATIQLTGTPANGTWAALASNPAGMSVSNAGLVTITNADAQGKSYSFVYTLNGCKDTLQITAAVCCVKPVAAVSPKTQTICSGATASAYAATPSTGVEYKWFGPLTDTTGAFGTAISGQTNASFTPSGTALTITGTKYFAVIVNTTGNTTCSDTAFVQLIVNPKPTPVNFAAASVCVGAEVTYPDPSGTNGTWTGPGVTDTGTEATVNTTTALTQLAATAPKTFYIYYTQTTAGCTQKDSAEITVKARPVVTISGPTTVCETGLPVNFTGSPAGGTFTLPQGFPAGAATQNGSTLTLNPGFNIASLTFSYSYTDATTSCSASASHSITVNPKPNAGQDQTLACANPTTNTLTTSTTLSPSPGGGTWAQLGTTPVAATISGNSVSGMTVAGTYQFIYTTTAGCKDTVAVIVQPCAGCVKPNAGPDAAAVCQPTSTSKLTAVTSGGMWAPIGSPANPSAASIDASGNITGLSAAGIYKFVYSVTSGGQTCTDTAQVEVKAKPVIADGSATICAGESVDLISKIVNYNTYQGQVWTVGTANGTVVTTPSSVKPTGTTTYVLVAQNAAGCKDTAQVVVTVNPKPNAGQDQTLACANPTTNTLTTSTTLSPSPAGGTWAQLGTTPVAATISGNSVSGMTVAGTYQFIYTTTAGCKDTVAVIVQPCAGCVKPNAGPDAAAVCQPTSTSKLTAVTSGGTWAPIGSPANPSSASIDASGNITGLSAAGIYKFVYSVTSGGQTCTDTAQVEVKAKPVIADGSATICAGESVDLISKIVNYNTYQGQVWTVGTANGTVVTTPSSVKPTGTTTYILVAQNAAGCKDTAQVVVTVNPKPNAGQDQTLACANPTTNTLTTSTTLSPSPAGGTWAQLGTTPVAATISGNSVSGMTVAGTYQFIYTTTAGCKDTVAVIVQPCAVCTKPNAGNDQTLVCGSGGVSPTTATLAPVTTGGVWSVMASNPAVATISGNAVSGMTAVGTYKFIYSITSGGQTCTDTVQVVVPTCVQEPVACTMSMTATPGSCIPATGTYTLTGKLTLSNPPTSGTLTVSVGGVEQVFSAPFTSPINYTLSGLPSDGQAQVVTAAFSADGACKSSLTYSAPANCKTNPCTTTLTAVPAACNPTTGLYELNGSVSFTNAPTTGTMTVTVDGQSQVFNAPFTSPQAYNIKNLMSDGSGHLVTVKFSADGSCVGSATYTAPANCRTNECGVSVTAIPGNCIPASNTYSVSGIITVANAPATGTMTVTVGGKSQVFTAPFSASQTYSLAGLVSDGAQHQVKVSFSATSICSATATYKAPQNCSTTQQCAINVSVEGTLCNTTTGSYTLNGVVNFVSAPTTGTLTIVAAGKTLTFNAPFSSPMSFSLTGLTGAGNQTVTASFSASSCSATTTYAQPNCGCVPSNPAVLVSSVTACLNDTFPTLRATVIGQATIDWFTLPSGGAPVAVGTTSFKPAGNVTGTVTFYVQARSTNGTCAGEVSERIPVTVTAQNCLVEIDLALKKLISKKIAQVGEELTYTIKVYNQSGNAATNVAVTDTLPTAVQFVANSFAASRGSATLTGNIINWSIGNIAANGDTVTLTYRVKVLQPGLYFNKAEITSAGEKDVDSTPGNNQDAEDDLDRQCFTVPIPLCSGSKVEVSIGTNYTGVRWFKDGQELTTLAGQHVVLLDAVGNYTYTATNGGCPTGGCCPIIIQAGTNCCSDQLCVPFTTRKIKK
ncbi:DUF11 domain-containing protein [Runella sp. SP2]|uniref:DUF7933 domain-containing protein n=1 Tax=Runella sp. SP2 TaxID=2268026 RepID=UPI0013DD87AC|nr:DUF11 domain-containing protein [Runella sp. SP2]